MPARMMVQLWWRIRVDHGLHLSTLGILTYVIFPQKCIVWLNFVALYFMIYLVQFMARMELAGMLEYLKCE